MESLFDEAQRFLTETKAHTKSLFVIGEKYAKEFEKDNYRKDRVVRMDFSVHFSIKHSIDRTGIEIESAAGFYSLWIFLKGNFTTISNGAFEYEVWNYIKKNISLQSYPRFKHPEFSNTIDELK